MISNSDYKYICTDVTKVENYEEALNDQEEKYVLHHVLEWKYSSAELQVMNMYYHRPPGEFLFVTEDTHKQSRWIHKARRIPMMQYGRPTKCDTVLSRIDRLERMLRTMKNPDSAVGQKRKKELKYLKEIRLRYSTNCKSAIIIPSLSI